MPLPVRIATSSRAPTSARRSRRISIRGSDPVTWRVTRQRGLRARRELGPQQGCPFAIRTQPWERRPQGLPDEWPLKGCRAGDGALMSICRWEATPRSCPFWSTSRRARLLRWRSGSRSSGGASAASASLSRARRVWTARARAIVPGTRADRCECASKGGHLTRSGLDSPGGPRPVSSEPMSTHRGGPARLAEVAPDQPLARVYTP